MNEEMKKELLSALLMLAHISEAGEDNRETTHLSLQRIHRFIDKTGLEIEKPTSEICPIRMLFNLIEGLSAKVEVLEEEVNFVKNGWNPNEPVKISN